jgi:hypothetical protein
MAARLTRRSRDRRGPAHRGKGRRGPGTPRSGRRHLAPPSRTRADSMDVQLSLHLRRRSMRQWPRVARKLRDGRWRGGRPVAVEGRRPEDGRGRACLLLTDERRARCLDDELGRIGHLDARGVGITTSSFPLRISQTRSRRPFRSSMCLPPRPPARRRKSAHRASRRVPSKRIGRLCARRSGKPRPLRAGRTQRSRPPGSPHAEQLEAASRMPSR